MSNLGFAASELGAAGIRLLIEPINTRDIPGFYLNYSGQALSIIEEVGSDNLWLQYDVYHMQIMEGDLTPTMRENAGSIGHIQIADTPGRHEPGTGEINYAHVFSVDRRHGIRGVDRLRVHSAHDDGGGARLGGGVPAVSRGLAFRLSPELDSEGAPE